MRSWFVVDDGAVYESGRSFPSQDGCGMWRPRQVVGGVGEQNSEDKEEQSVSASEDWRGGRRIVSVAAGHFAAYALDGSYLLLVLCSRGGDVISHRDGLSYDYG